MATKKCIGVREDTGDPCKRTASSGSDFCFAHRPQEEDERIPYLQHDVVHCPEDGQKLSYIPMDNQFVCDMCGGVLQNAKDINPMALESILELPEVADEGLEIRCPTCSTNNDKTESLLQLAFGEFFISDFFAVEWQFTTGSGRFQRHFQGVSNVGHCKVCGSTWFCGSGDLDASGTKISQKFKKLTWRDAFRRIRKSGNLWKLLGKGSEGGIFGGGNPFDEKEQSRLRESRLRAIDWAAEREEWRDGRLCRHVDSSGERCNKSKNKRGSDYCYKHRPR